MEEIAAGESDHRGLGDAVHEVAGRVPGHPRPHHAGDGTHVDDHAASAPLEDRERVLHGQEHQRQLVREVPVPVGTRHVLEVRRLGNRRIVVEDVEVAVGLDRERDPRLDCALIGEVHRLQRNHLATRGPHHRDGLLGLGDLDVATHDLGTLGREVDRRPTALAARGATDQCDLVT